MLAPRYLWKSSSFYWDNCNMKHLTRNVGVLSPSQLLYFNVLSFNVVHYYLIASSMTACPLISAENYTLYCNFFPLPFTFLFDSILKLYQVLFFHHYIASGWLLICNFPVQLIVPLKETENTCSYIAQLHGHTVYVILFLKLHYLSCKLQIYLCCRYTK